MCQWVRRCHEFVRHRWWLGEVTCWLAGRGPAHASTGSFSECNLFILTCSSGFLLTILPWGGGGEVAGWAVGLCQGPCRWFAAAETLLGSYFFDTVSSLLFPYGWTLSLPLDGGIREWEARGHSAGLLGLEGHFDPFTVVPEPRSSAQCVARVPILLSSLPVTFSRRLPLPHILKGRVCVVDIPLW